LAALALAVVATGLLGSGPARAATGLEGVPAYDHIAVVVLENEDATSSFGPASPATWLNGIKDDGAFLPQYYGTSHLSLGNYITMVSGQVSGPTFDADCTGLSLWTCAQGTVVQGGRHLGDQLDDAGVTWRSYMDGTSTPCFHAPYVAGDLAADPYQGDSRTGPGFDYADRHNPFIYFDDFSSVTTPGASCTSGRTPSSPARSRAGRSRSSRSSRRTPATTATTSRAPTGPAAASAAPTTG
jgi:hypothetical protein